MGAGPSVSNSMPLAVHYGHTPRLWMLSCSTEHCRQTVLLAQSDLSTATGPFSWVRLFLQNGVFSSSLWGVYLVINIWVKWVGLYPPKPRPKTQQRFTCQTPYYYKSARLPQVCTACKAWKPEGLCSSCCVSVGALHWLSANPEPVVTQPHVHSCPRGPGTPQSAPSLEGVGMVSCLLCPPVQASLGVLSPCCFPRVHRFQPCNCAWLPFSPPYIWKPVPVCPSDVMQLGVKERRRAHPFTLSCFTGRPRFYLLVSLNISPQIYWLFIFLLWISCSHTPSFGILYPFNRYTTKFFLDFGCQL